MNSKIKGHLAAVLCVFIWGTTFISTKILLEKLEPVEILFYRFLMGYGILWVVCPRTLKLKNQSHELYFFAAGATGVTIYYLCENIALAHTRASNVSIIASLAPFFTAVFASLLLKDEKLKRWFLPGFIVALCGVCMVTFNGNAVMEMNPLGDFLALGGAVIWAVYSIIIRKMSSLGYSVVLTTRRIFFYGLLLMIPLLGVLGFQGNISAVQEPVYLGNLLFLGICSCALCFVIWNYAVDVLGAVVSSNYIYAVPVVTVVVSMVVLKEQITVMGIAGMVLTIVGLMISAK